jgi:DHA1 family inner membrane transport protein
MQVPTSTSLNPSDPVTTRARAGLPPALYALTVGAFGIGTTEFVIMGLLLQVAADLQVSIAAAGLLISGYALGVFVGAPVLTILTSRLPRKAVLMGLMLLFIVGNVVCALAPNYAVLMVARVITALMHGTFFGVGAVVATGLVSEDRKASAISVMFTGLTVATLLGVPAGAWLGHEFGWRSTFWAVSMIGVVGFAVIALLVPRQQQTGERAGMMKEELAAVLRPQVLLGLLITVLGWAGVFAVFTYIEPILTRVTGFAQELVSPILFAFGGGMVLGNYLGGKLADRKLMATMVGTLVFLALVLAGMTVAMHSKVGVVICVGLRGGGAFATVAPLQLRVLQKAGGGQTLASSLNIGAFNLGNAIGAWMGGVIIERGAGVALSGYQAVPVAAALVAAGGVGLALWSWKMDGRQRTPLRQD